jgi:hypothetical protein
VVEASGSYAGQRLELPAGLPPAAPPRADGPPPEPTR